MGYPNLTPVQIGMTGKFAGKSYRVASRVIMSMDEAGETYTWSEFYLVGDDGSSATLVHEPTEDGAAWRLFTMFEPDYPMTAAEATTKRVGDKINFTETTLEVTCVDESRVCQIEGEAPEGVEPGDVARYFNAESGHEMIVVSWTGDEIEFYRGLTLPAHVVMGALGISGVPAGALRHLSGDDRTGSRKAFQGIIGMVVFAAAIVVAFFWHTRRSDSPPTPKLPKAQLTVGKSGELNSTQYRVVGRAAVEISHVGKRQLRHEYSIADDSGNEALLVQGNDHWVLLSPFSPARPLTPRDAGKQRLGSPVSLDDTTMNVTELFLSRVQQVEGQTPLSKGAELYGFATRNANNTIVARWNENTITFYRATPFSGKEPPWQSK